MPFLDEFCRFLGNGLADGFVGRTVLALVIDSTVFDDFTTGADAETSFTLADVAASYKCRGCSFHCWSKVPSRG